MFLVLLSHPQGISSDYIFFAGLVHPVGAGTGLAATACVCKEALCRGVAAGCAGGGFPVLGKHSPSADETGEVGGNL